MPDNKLPIKQAVDQSIQSSAFTSGTSGASILLVLGRANDIISPWWSVKRDIELRSFWKKVDPLAGAIYTLITKMVTVPVTVLARDMSIRKHVELAEQYTDLLRLGSQFGQGGRVFFENGEAQLDLRASFYVTVHGEKIVLRLLNRQGVLIQLEALGLSPRMLERFKEDALYLPSGVLLVTGPTGSGKTTTVYSCINHINDPQTSLITAEEPVE
mgnify:CR=1 FL=1